MFHKAAIDYAREENYPEIVRLLSKGSIKVNEEGEASKSSADNDNDHGQNQKTESLESKIQELELEMSRLKERNAQLEEENRRLKEESVRRKEEDHKSNEKSENTEKQVPFKILDEKEVESLENIEELGSGGGGKVMKVAKKEIYALKTMNIKTAKTANFRNFMKEYEIMTLLDHQNILKAIGFFMSSAKLPPSILMEFCSLNLQKAIEDKIFNNEELAKIIYQIAEGMKYIHFKKIIHRDLKPTNILIASDGTVKICDFGISKLMTIEEQTMTRGIGSQKFMAPEIINEEEYYDEKVDVYSFGVLVFFILTGGQLPKIKVFDMLKGKKADIPSSFTEFSKKMINECWNLEAKDRPSFESIVDDMERSHYNLLALSNTEIKNVENFVKQHKAKLPKY